MNLDTQTAVKLAKAWLASQLSEEGISNIGLEEVRWTDAAWEITLGFSRPWDEPQGFITPFSKQPRTYKVIRISDAEQSVVEMRNREAA